MSTTSSEKKTRGGLRIPRSAYPTLAALILLAVLLVGGQLIYGKIFRFNTIASLIDNNAYLIILAMGLTFCILTGGIDLSVGAVVAFSSVAGVMMLNAGVPFFIVMPAMVLMGTAFGLLSGILVQYFNVQPFIATLSTMFLARGLASILSTEPVRIDPENPIMGLSERITLISLPKNNFYISVNVIIAIVVVAIAYFLLHKTRFGRTVYGLGENEQSVELMGLPAARTNVLVYVISGTCSGLAALVYATTVGNAQNITGTGWEMDAIAAAVIGGTLLTGGTGYVLGSVGGVFVLGTLRLLINRDGSVPAAATTIITGAILLIFVLLQRAIAARTEATGGAGIPGEGDAPKAKRKKKAVAASA